MNSSIVYGRGPLFLEALAEGGDILLDASGARHVISVLRLKPGDALIVFNGHGGEYSARLLDADGKHARVQLEHYQEGLPPSPLSITLISSPECLKGFVLVLGSRWVIFASIFPV